ncbi:MAG: glycosyltransferase family 2 protein [Luteolibacter sp.]
MNAKLSIVVPFYNEEETVADVVAEILRAVPGAEVIAVDDGSKDRTWEILSAIPGIRAMRFQQNRGQSAAMYAGMRQASREIVALMDGDGQNDPADFPKLVEALEQGADVACGYRANRQDTASRRYASKIANKIRRAFLHDGVRDTGCSLKAFRREAVDHLVPFNGMHRYIPAQLLRAGMKIVELPVNHRGRMAGTSKYTNWDRALRGIHDLIGVSWLLKRKVNIRFD